MPPKKTIAVILESISAQRLAESMFAYFRPDRTVWLVDAQRPTKEILAQLEQWKPDGIVSRIKPDLNRALQKLGKPMVICGGAKAARALSSVGSDGREIGRLAARHLLDLGLRNFGYLGMDAPFSIPRHLGFSEELAQAGFACLSHTADSLGWPHYMEMLHSPDEGLLAWMQQLSKPVGIFAAHDPLGWHLAHVCLQADIAVPDEVAIVGANNDELVCKLSSPALSSVAIPWRRIGAESALEMDRMLECAERGEIIEGRIIRLSPEGVVTRQSTDMLAIDNPVLRKAVAFIKAHASEPISVTDVVAQVPVSRRKLELDFMRQLHRSPKEEITRTRIERAKLMLAETDLPVAIVAERCGFNDPERFSATFKLGAGQPPATFRKSMRANGGRG